MQRNWQYYSLILLLTGSWFMNLTAQSASNATIDMLLLNGRVWTVWDQQPWAEAIAITGERIIAVGSSQALRALAGKNTRIIDLKGKLVLPGFNDAHVHFCNGGFSLIGIQLRNAANETEFAQRIQQYAATLPSGAWITGGEWDHEAWPSKKFPTKALIDPVTPQTPVLVDRLDGHVSVANSLALQLAGVNAQTADPAGGKIDRDPISGEPTGILWDEAISLVGRVIPRAPHAQVWRAIQAALQHAAGVGVTSVQDQSSGEDLQIYQELLRQQQLTVRINAWRIYGHANNFKEIGIRAPFGNSMLRIGTMKLFSDGSMGAGSALFFKPYADAPETRGLGMYSEAEIYQIVREIDAAGLQLATHAIGDSANRLVLDAYEKAWQENKRTNARHRIEHAQVVSTPDLSRFAKLGVIASIQPSHCIDDMRWAERRIGVERSHDAYRFKSLVTAGAKLAFGTDWPVEPLNPMLGIYAAVTREFPEGGPAGGWHPAEKLSLAEAIEFYTRGSAYAEFTEAEKGSITPGKLADLIVLSKNLFEIPPREILTTQVELTILGGKIIFEKK